jgi:hypothetical protein
LNEIGDLARTGAPGNLETATDVVIHVEYQKANSVLLDARPRLQLLGFISHDDLVLDQQQLGQTATGQIGCWGR